MQANSQRHPVEGTVYPHANANVVGSVDGGEKIEVVVIVRSKHPIPADLKPFSHLTRPEFLDRYGPADADLKAVTHFVKDHGIKPTIHPARRSVVLNGTINQIEKAFGIKASMYLTKDGKHRGYAGQVTVPENLKDVVVAVLGLHTNRTPRGTSTASGAANGYGPNAKPKHIDTAQALKSFYKFPDGDGAGQTVGIIEMGGGYRKKDINRFFSSLGIKPNYSDTCVGEGPNRGTNHKIPKRFLRAFADWMNSKGPYMEYAKSYFEVTMDISMIGALAPKANMQVYFGYDSTLAFMHLIEQALFLSDPQPSVLSISWGFQEREILNDSSDIATAHYINDLFLSAAHMGVTVCCSAGDWGASNQVEDGFPGHGYDIEFPASSPYALACGGTTITEENKEVVWNADFPPPSDEVPKDSLKHGATGGGYSRIFDRPEWQKDLKHSGEGAHEDKCAIPDVAGLADPHCGIRCMMAGTTFPTGGTSAATPMWAALVALLNQNLDTRVGCLNPILYQMPDSRSGAFNDITSGDNKFSADDVGFQAGPGWDACTGFGTPQGEALLAMLGSIKGNG